MKHIRLVLLLVIWALPAGSASAGTPIPTDIVLPAADVPVETSPVHHEQSTNGPIVIKYDFKKSTGFANLIINPDGSYLYSGKYKASLPYTPIKENYDFSVMLAMKSSLGGMMLFQYTGPDNGNVVWSKEGKSDILKDNFKTFSGKHSWAVTYHIYLTKSSKKSLWKYCQSVASSFPPEWMNSKGKVFLGWSPGELALIESYHCPASE